ncbi:hypothetical protein BDY24DRAFT_418354 [Mrakia frigida]|uniref:uncharacterized protein n=1 Tax=Mrakia frigida TaxID=29902 RepID=UPI003FCBFD87
MAPLPRSRLLLLLFAVLLPQFGLAWAFGIDVNPLSLPEPLLSLLLLTVLSAFVHFFLKPIALDYTISPDLDSLKRHDAAWISSNVQFLSFFGLIGLNVYYAGRSRPEPPIESSPGELVVLEAGQKGKGDSLV